MREYRPLFMLIVIALVLALVIPMSGSADRGLPKETPIPILVTQTPTPVMTKATPTPTSGEDIVCFDMSTVDEAVGSFGPSDILCVDMSQVREGIPDSRVILGRLGSSTDFDDRTPEDIRVEFLDLLSMLEELGEEAPSAYEGLTELQASLEREQARIQNLTDEQLLMLRSAYRDLEEIKAGIQAVESQVLTAKGRASKGGEGPDPSLGSFPTFPTPTPVTIPTPGIVHDQDVHDAVNEQTGDLYPPDMWPDLWNSAAVGCPQDGYPWELSAAFVLAIDAAKMGEIVTEAICKSKTVTCPGTNVYDVIDCIPQAVAKSITFALGTLQEGFEFCNGNVQSAMIEALYHDTEIMHAHLYDHDQNLTTRFNWTDKFLFDFRNLNLRLEIEANLASPDDDPHALLALPRSVCISPELEALQLTDPFASEVIAGCGLLEVVSDTVRSAMDMTLNAGEGVNNAEAEFAAAVAHYNNGEWKLAYARFRKAYREAVRP